MIKVYIVLEILKYKLTYEHPIEYIIYLNEILLKNKKSRDFDFLDLLFNSIKLEEYDVYVYVSLLRVTYNIRNELCNWNSLYDRIREIMKSNNQNVDLILMGLR